MIMASFFSTVFVYNAQRLLPKQPKPEQKKIIISCRIRAFFFDKDLNSVPDGHEREAYEETKGASYVRNQWDERVDQNL